MSESTSPNAAQALAAPKDAQEVSAPKPYAKTIAAWKEAQAAHDKIGAGTLGASGRQGVKELGAAFGQALPDSIQIDEPGTIFNAPAMDAYDARHGLEPGRGREIEMERD